MSVPTSPVMYNALRLGRLVALALVMQVPGAGAADLRERAAAMFGALEAVTPAAMAHPRVDLGRALFWDTRLSAGGETACASCHRAADWGSDRRQRSPDARGRFTRRHSQSVLNVVGAVAGLRWTADRASGAEQAWWSITGSMGFVHRDALVESLHEHGYAALFRQAFPDSAAAVSAEHYAQALQHYQETLRTPAPFDAWLNGDDTALDARQRRGLEHFIASGCGACHDGPLFGGGSLQRFGVVEDYRAHTGSAAGDTGVMEQTGMETDRDRFRVQPLRNVARTAPYFHDGTVATLGEAVAIMAAVQLGRTLDSATIDDIVHFLQALTGPLPRHYGPPPTAQEFPRIDEHCC